MNAPQMTSPAGEETKADLHCRVRIMRVSQVLFLELFKQGDHPAYRVIDNAIPDGARVVNCRFGWPECIEILIESEYFDEVPEGGVIPYISPLCERPASPSAT